MQNNEVSGREVKKDKKELTKGKESDRINARSEERNRKRHKGKEREKKNLKKLEKTS